MDEEGYFTVFASNGSSGGYDVKSVFTYFGNYFADLEEGDLVVFMGAGDDRMYPADQADFKPEAPYKSGLYHVGTDIPAGTYAITVQDEAAAVADQDSAAYVMNSLDFDLSLIHIFYKRIRLLLCFTSCRRTPLPMHANSIRNATKQTPLLDWRVFRNSKPNRVHQNRFSIIETNSEPKSVTK